MARQCYLIDAFSGERFSGNAAGVVLDAEGLDDCEMQKIAAEFNQSETTFVLPPQTADGEVRFRWFTPTTEVSMCGHATLAGVHALVEAGRLDVAAGVETAIRIDTLSGTLAALVEGMPGGTAGRMIWLDMPKPTLEPIKCSFESLATVLNVPVDEFDTDLSTVRTQEQDIIVFAKDFMVVNDAKPDFGALRDLQLELGLRGLCLATTRTLSPTIHAQSRFFAPAAGIDEDPVTGSVHGPLAVYLTKNGRVPSTGELSGLQCVQSKSGGRSGVVYALVQKQPDESYEVRIGGQTITSISGTLLG